MSKKSKNSVVNTSSEFKVVETIYVAPGDLFRDEDSRVRPAANQDQIDQTLAISLAKHGQEQPVNAYRDGLDGKLITIGGHTRGRAGVLLVNGFEAVDPDTGKLATFSNPDFKLRVDIVEVKSKEDAFLKGLVDNVYRSKLTPVQQALAQEKLRKDFDWSDTKIASLFGYSNTNRVAQLKKLMKLEQEIIDAVHEDRLALSIAADVLADVKNGETRLKIVAQATDDATGEVIGSKVKELVRALYEPTADTKAKGEEGDEEEEGDDEDKGAVLKRSVKDFNNFLENMKQEGGNANAVALFEKLSSWFKFKCGDRALYNTIDETVKAK